MQDIPDKSALLGAVRRFLKDDLLPVVPDPSLRYRVLVALSLLGVVERELALGDGHYADEIGRLAELLEAAEVDDLSALQSDDARRAALTPIYERLLADDATDQDALFAHVKATLADKLAVVNPRFDLSATAQKEP